jgi:hypothetical protein
MHCSVTLHNNLANQMRVCPNTAAVIVWFRCTTAGANRSPALLWIAVNRSRQDGAGVRVILCGLRPDAVRLYGCIASTGIAIAASGTEEDSGRLGRNSRWLCRHTGQLPNGRYRRTSLLCVLRLNQTQL